MNYKQKSEQLGHLLTMDLFVRSLDPSLRSPQFAWSRFPDMAAGSVTSQLCLYFSEYLWARHKTEIRALAEASAKATALDCMSMSGVQRWLPLPALPALTNEVPR